MLYQQRQPPPPLPKLRLNFLTVIMAMACHNMAGRGSGTLKLAGQLVTAHTVALL